MWADWVRLLAAANVGIMVFFTVAVAPTLFTALPPEWSPACVRKLFAKYFFFLGVTAAAACEAAFSGGAGRVGQVVLAGCGLVFFFSCFWLTPRINRARDEKQAPAFKALRSVSVGLNMPQLLVFMALLIWYGWAT